MSRDLLEFATMLSHGIDRATQMYEKNLDRGVQERRYQTSLEIARARNEVQNARLNEWAKTQQDYRNYLRARTAKLSGAGGGAGTAAPAVSPALQAEQTRAAQAGYTPPVPTPASNVYVNADTDVPAPPQEPPDIGSDQSNFRRGGRVRKFANGGNVSYSTAGTNGPGSGFGIKAAPPIGYRPGMRKGGAVKFAGGGDTRRWWEAVGGPDEYSANKRVDVEAERQRTRDEGHEAAYNAAENVPTPRGGRRRIEDNTPPESGTGGPQETRWPDRDSADQYYPTPQRGGDSPDQYYQEVKRGRSGTAAATEPSATPKGVGGGRAAQGTQRGTLRDPNRTAAFDPVLDANDPDNVGAVDTTGRTNTPTQAASVSVPDQQRGITPASGMTGGPAEGTTLSTNNAAQDLALQGGNNWADFTFHQHQADYHTQAGKHALLSGHGAATPSEMDAVFKALNLPETMPLDQKMHLAMTAAHQFGAQQGKPEQGDKMAFEVMQFGNVMAKQHGSAAVQAAQQGDLNQAAHQLLAGFNWLPNGVTANIDQGGKNFVLTDRTGKPVGQFPINAQTVQNFALGMASGELNWDVMKGRPQAPQGAPQGGGLPPQVNQPPSAIQTQPPTSSAAPATAAPQGAVSPQSTGAPVSQPPQAPPSQAVETSPKAAGTAQPAQPQDPYAMPKGMFTLTNAKPTDFNTLKQYDDPTFDQDMARYNKGLSQVQAGKGGQREAAAWNHLMSWRSAKHAELSKARAARENELNREQSRALDRETAELGKARRGKEQEEDNLSTNISNQIKTYEKDPRMMDHSALSWMDTDEKRSDLVQAISNVYRHNSSLSSAQATRLVMGATDVGEGKGMNFRPLGGTALKGVVAVAMRDKGVWHPVLMPKATYTDLVNIHKETIDRVAKAKADKADEKAQKEKMAIEMRDVMRASPGQPGMVMSPEVLPSYQ